MEQTWSCSNLFRCAVQNWNPPLFRISSLLKYYQSLTFVSWFTVSNWIHFRLETFKKWTDLKAFGNFQNASNLIRQISRLLKWEIETSYGWVKNELSWFSYTSWHWKYSFRLQKGIKILNHHTLNLFETFSCRQKYYINHSHINIVNQTSPFPFLLSITT